MLLYRSFLHFLGATLARRHAKLLGVESAISLGYIFFLAGGIFFWLTILQPNFSAAQMIAAMSVLTLGNGFLLPIGTTATFSVDAGRAIFPAAMLGFFQFSIAAISAFVASALLVRGNNLVGAMLACIVLIAFGVNLIIRRQEHTNVRAVTQKAPSQT